MPDRYAPLDPSRLSKEDLEAFARDIQRFMFGVFDEPGNLVGWSAEGAEDSRAGREGAIPGAELVEWLSLHLERFGLYPGQQRKQDWTPPSRERGPGSSER